MTLKEKLDIIKNYDEQDPYQTFMTIADDYAIEFYNWVVYESDGHDFISKTPKQLLEIFKKEKGL